MIKAGDLKPGDRISVDQYESAVLGCLLGSKGWTKEELMFNGGISSLLIMPLVLFTWSIKHLLMHLTLFVQRSFLRD